MRPALRRLHSPDIRDLKTYAPEEDDKFGFLLQVLVGPANGEGEESSDVVGCTPRWLSEKYKDSDILLGLHKLIVFKYDYVRLHAFIEKFLPSCSGISWTKIARKVDRLGHWEFEGYTEKPKA